MKEPQLSNSTTKLICSLPMLPKERLSVLWLENFGKAAGSIRAELMIPILAFRIQENHTDLWDLYMELDSIWLRILEICIVGTTVERGLPLILFMNTHAKMRVAIELAFAGCMSEARSILRDAVEFIAHAHRLLSDANLQLLWGDRLARPDDWKTEFWH